MRRYSRRQPTLVTRFLRPEAADLQADVRWPPTHFLLLGLRWF